MKTLIVFVFAMVALASIATQTRHAPSFAVAQSSADPQATTLAPPAIFIRVVGSKIAA